MSDKLSRRGLFRAVLSKAQGLSDPDEKKDKPNKPNTPLVLLRPPMALPESEFITACDRCNACVEACPYDALLRVKEGHAEGTPTFVMHRSPCRLCPDMPCVVACPTEALSLEREVKIGRAYLRVMDCLASAATFCSVCLERCPEDAIVLERGKPKIKASLCVGCGECVYRCPAPVRALIVLPR